MNFKNNNYKSITREELEGALEEVFKTSSTHEHKSERKFKLYMFASSEDEANKQLEYFNKLFIEEVNKLKNDNHLFNFYKNESKNNNK